MKSHVHVRWYIITITQHLIMSISGPVIDLQNNVSQAVLILLNVNEMSKK